MFILFWRFYQTFCHLWVELSGQPGFYRSVSAYSGDTQQHKRCLQPNGVYWSLRQSSVRRWGCLDNQGFTVNVFFVLAVVYFFLFHWYFCISSIVFILAIFREIWFLTYLPFVDGAVWATRALQKRFRRFSIGFLSWFINGLK